MNLTIMLPIKTVSEQNLREHWGSRSRRTKKQKQITENAVHRHVGV